MNKIIADEAFSIIQSNLDSYRVVSITRLEKGKEPEKYGCLNTEDIGLNWGMYGNEASLVIGKDDQILEEVSLDLGRIAPSYETEEGEFYSFWSGDDKIYLLAFPKYELKPAEGMND